MAFDAKILADSVSPAGVRLVTYEVTMPRIVLAEFNTHKMISKSSASSRAIPVEKMIKRVLEEPYIPSSWGKNQKGMQADVEVSSEDGEKAKREWLIARDNAVVQTWKLLELGIHKQTTNRLLEPFMWHTVICTATELSNFFHLRNNEKAHPDIQIPARMMQQLYESHEPELLGYDEWHLPLFFTEDETIIFRTQRAGRSYEECQELMRKVSVGRCARISYLTHDGKRDLAADIELHDSLLKNGHMAPLEHVARPAHPYDEKTCSVKFAQVREEQEGFTNHVDPESQWSGNLRGWVQYRKTIPHEDDILAVRP